MNSYLSYIIFLSLLLFGCSTDIPKTDDSSTDVQQKIEKEDGTLSKKDSIELYNNKGREEYNSFIKKYESEWDNEKPSQFPYSNIETIKVYPLLNWVEYKHDEFRKRTSNGIEINKKELYALVEIFSDQNSYGGGQAACYNPGFGLVAYDKEGVPTEWLSICLDCNRFLTYPGKIQVDFENELMRGLNTESRMKIRNLIMKWGIDYYGFSEFYDDEALYQVYLKKKRLK